MRHLNSICFVVKGNKKIGLGHVYRCITIASEAIKRNLQVSFIIQKDESVEALLNANKISFIALLKDLWDNPSSYKKLINNILEDSNIVLLDLLEKDFKNFEFISELDKKIISITSFYYAEDNRYEDISFFPGIEIKEHTHIKNSKTKLFSGPKYLTFREEFKRDFKKCFNEKTSKILITMGGSDAFGFTPIAVKALLNLKLDFEATIILGSAASTFNEVSKLVNNNSNIKVLQSVDNISDLMHSSTIAIINGGLTRYELALTGTPFIALSVHQVQFEITERLTSLVGGVNLGIVKKLSLDEITNAIEELIKNKEKRMAISKALQKIIDSKGTSRILDCIESF